MTKFWLGEENFPRQKFLPHQIFPEKVIVFPKSAVTPSKMVLINTHCYQFLWKGLQAFA